MAELKLSFTIPKSFLFNSKKPTHFSLFGLIVVILTFAIISLSELYLVEIGVDTLQLILLKDGDVWLQSAQILP